MITSIKELPNAWGWHGKTDRTGYQVWLHGKLWATYCYMNVALAAADRIEAEHKRIEREADPEGDA